MRTPNFFARGGALAWGLIGAVLLVFAASAVLLGSTMDIRFRRDVSRMVFNHNMDLLEEVRREVGENADTLSRALQAAPETPAPNQAYIVVSIAENRLWYRRGDSVLFEAGVATGSGKEMSSDGRKFRFDTPRGRLVVQRKDSAPVWVPPDWHYIEAARKKGLGVIELNRGKSVPASDGSVVTVEGNDVVKRYPDGRVVALESGEGKEIVVGGNVVIPPFGTNQRKQEGVLGTHRLYLGDGYGLHGTNNPASIGRSVSHGCVRLRNEDIGALFEMVSVGTPVYIY